MYKIEKNEKGFRTDTSYKPTELEWEIEISGIIIRLLNVFNC